MTVTLNPIIKAEWIRRLRSGNYVQGAELLKYVHSVYDVEDVDELGDTTDILKYCCLGVLCEMAVEVGIVSKDHPVSDTYQFGATRDETLLPAEVSEWATRVNGQPGVIEVDFKVPDPGDDESMKVLAELNDAGCPFEKIAELIRDNL